MFEILLKQEESLYSELKSKDKPRGEGKDCKEKKRKSISNVYTTKSENEDADKHEIYVEEGIKIKKVFEMESYYVMILNIHFLNKGARISTRRG